MNCPTCNEPMRTIPAGVSKKTGKAYRAFEACDKTACKDAKSQSRPQAQYPAQNATQASFSPNYDEKIAALELALANMRVWAAKVEKRLSGAETLLEGMQTNKEALPLHQSFKPRDIHEAKDIVENGIPVIDEVPKGFDK